jgi:hypothetical protein
MSFVCAPHVKKTPEGSPPVWAILAATALLVLTANFAAAQKSAAPKVESMDPKTFERPTIIDNKWLPMKPGTRWIYEGTTVEDDGKVVPHRVEITITPMTKVIGGVRNVVSYDQDYVENELVETRLAFYAQDNEGTVWHFGRHAEEFEDGKLTKSTTWLHGIEDARAGIAMKAKPQAGAPSYSIGWGPAVDWAARGQVFRVGQKTAVRAGKYDDVLVVKETGKEDTAEPYLLKHYASGIGYVRLGTGGKKAHAKEVLELIKVEQLGAREIAAIREKAMNLEKSAYKLSKAVYARSAPMEASK